MAEEIQIVTAAQLKAMFGMDDVQLDLLLSNGCPHFRVHGAVSFQLNDTYPWIVKHYYRGEGDEVAD